MLLMFCNGVSITISICLKNEGYPAMTAERDILEVSY